MSRCDEIRPFLEEYHDGELAGAVCGDVRAHRAACEACSRELDALEKLEGILRASGAKDHPDWDGCVAAVHRRIGAAGRKRWTAFVPAAAAALLLAVFSLMFGVVRRPDVAALVDRHSAGSRETRRSIERELSRAGGKALAELKALAKDPSPRRQASACAILAWHADGAVRQWLMESTQDAGAPAEEWTLAEIGLEPSDDELVGCGFELLKSSRTREEAVRVLRKLDMGGVNRSAHALIVGRVRDMLVSPSGPEQELALDLVRGLGLRALLPSLVDLLDIPGMGDRALDVLKNGEKVDFGKDKEAWKRHFGRRL